MTDDVDVESGAGAKRMRVYKYGLLPPTLNGHLVMQQMRLANDYRNVLVEIERERRSRVSAMLSACADVAAVEAEVARLEIAHDLARTELARTRKVARRRAESPEQRAAVRELGARLRDARAARAAAKRKVATSESIKVGMAWHVLWANHRVRVARKGSGVYFGTYLLQEAAADQANKSPSPPDFVPWRGSGRISVQLQGGIDLDELSGDTQVQLEVPVVPGPPRDWRPSERGLALGLVRRFDAVQGFGFLNRLDGGRIVEGDVFVSRYSGESGDGMLSLSIGQIVEYEEHRGPDGLYATVFAVRKARRVGRGARQSRTLRIRVQSDGRRRPIWAEFPMQMQRDLPEGARIKVVTVSRARRGVCWDWSAQFSVDETACAPRRAAPGSGVVALNLGFCLRPGGIRVGYVVGDDGREREILVADDIRSSLDRADEVRSERDLLLGAMRAELCAWIASKAQDQLPEWFRERTKEIASWRSFGRFAALALDWQVGWWEDGDAGYALIERWRVADLRLARYETGTRSTALRRRTDRFRVAAAELAREYRTLVVDDTDLSSFQRSPLPESEEVDREAVKRQQRIASGHDLRLAMMNAFSGRVDKRSSVGVTARCARCGHDNGGAAFDGPRERTCGGCGRVRDQDANACENHLAGHRGDAGGGGSQPGTAIAPRPSRRDRMVAARAARSPAAEIEQDQQGRTGS